MTPPLQGLFLWFNQVAGNTLWLNNPAALFAKYGIAIFAALLIVAWWVARGRSSRAMAAALLTPLATAVAFVAQQVVVVVVNEPRPYDVLSGITVLVSRTTDPSFPSDHACVAGAVTAGLFLVDRRLGWVSAACAALMALARVYVGVHWPLDVVAGLLFGGIIGLLVVLSLRPWGARAVTWARGNSLRPLVALA